MGRVNWILIAVLAILCNSLSCEVDINPSLNLVFTPDSLDFSIVPIGKSDTKSVELSNEGAKDIILTEIKLIFDDENPDKGEFAITDGVLLANIDLTPGNTYSVGITFAPSISGSKNIILKISYMIGKLQKDIIIPISAAAIESLIRITPEIHDFKHSYLDEVHKKVFLITNLVFRQVTIDSISLINYGSTTSNDEISITSGWDFVPRILEIGETIEIEITFNPKDVYAKSARMNVVVAGSEIDYYANISGWGSEKIAFITTSPLPEAVRGSSYELTFVATGGDGNYSFNIVIGNFPIGIAYCNNSMRILGSYMSPP